MLDAGSFMTGVIGVAMIRKRRRANFVTRGCECMCPCPFPAWSLFVQLLDIGSLVLGLTGRDGAPSSGDIVFGVMKICGVSLDIAFATTWLVAIHAQDGGICCGQSTLPRAPHQIGQEVVVGAALPVAGQSVTVAMGSDQAESGRSTLPRAPHQIGQEVVVGVALPVAGQSVTVAVGSDQAESGQIRQAVAAVATKTSL